MLLEAGNGSNSAGRCMIRDGASELAFSQAPHIDHRQQGRQRRTAGNGFVAETAPVGKPSDSSPKEKPKPSFSRYQSYKIKPLCQHLMPMASTNKSIAAIGKQRRRSGCYFHSWCSPLVCGQLGARQALSTSHSRATAHLPLEL